MKKILKLILPLLILYTFLSGLFTVNVPATIRGMNAAAQGQPGTAIFQSSEQIVFLWQQGANYAYAAVGHTGESVKHFVERIAYGTAGSPATITDLIDLMVRSGFEPIPPSQLPPEVLTAVTTYGGMLLSFVSLTPAVPGIYIIPADPENPFPFDILPETQA